MTMVALLVIPGGLLAVTLGLRGSTALAAAIPASVAMIATAGVATGFLPVSWGLLPVAAVTAIGVLVALGVRVAVGRLGGISEQARGRWGGRDELLTWLGIALAGGLIAFAFLRAIDTADSFSVGYDNFFHMGVIRTYLETGQAAPFVSYDLTDPSSGQYTYPTAWHQLAALLITTGVTSSIPVAQNALMLAVTALAWPASVFFWVRSIFRSGPALLLGTGVLAAGFAAYPFLLASYGPLHPYQLGLSMLPFGVGLVLRALRLGVAPATHWLTLATLGVIYLGAALIAHPNSVLGWMAISVSLLIALIVREIWRLRQGSVERRPALRNVAIASLIIVAGVIIWGQMRPGEHWWAPPVTMPQAFGEFWLAGPMNRPAALAIGLLVATALVMIIRSGRDLMLLAPTAMLLVLYLAATSFLNFDLRHLLTGGFYNDPARLGALIPMALLPLALLPLTKADQWLESRSFTPVQQLALLSAGTILLTWATQVDRNVREEVWNIADAYRVHPRSRELTTYELQMLRDLPKFVSPGDIVVADTLTGAGFMYALEGLHPIQYHPKEALSEAEEFLLLHLSDPAMEAEVCHAVSQSSADFVLDFGTEQINMDLEHKPPVGLQNLDDSPVLTQVHQVGVTRLFEITGCP